MPDFSGAGNLPGRGCRAMAFRPETVPNDPTAARPVKKWRRETLSEWNAIFSPPPVASVYHRQVYLQLFAAKRHRNCESSLHGKRRYCCDGVSNASVFERRCTFFAVVGQTLLASAF